MTSSPAFRSDVSVSLIDSMGGDQRLVQAARVSTKGAESVESAESAGLILYLMRNRHASPVEHTVMTFLVEAPIFVARAFMRHRIASYNEESGRYRTLRPSFYIPARDRKLTQIGKVGEYRFEPGTEEQHDLVEKVQERAYREAWSAYTEMLEAGIAREVARMVLPVGLFTSFYVTMNMRSLMNFLSLRTIHPEADDPSTPQREIEMVAEQMEESFADLMPITYTAWNEFGRRNL